MKIDWSMVITIAIAILVVALLNKFVLSKIGMSESLEADNYDDEDEDYETALTY